jgi:hypothetical protein
VVSSITNGIVLMALDLHGLLQMLKIKHRILTSNVTLAQNIYRSSRYLSKYVSKYTCLQIKQQFASSNLELTTNSMKHSS